MDAAKVEEQEQMCECVKGYILELNNPTGAEVGRGGRGRGGGGAGGALQLQVLLRWGAAAGAAAVGAAAGAAVGAAAGATAGSAATAQRRSR
jgi:hypothetical protein